ncbi:MAG: phosphate/phosphite/phosphonate ABC transporter substrate-binding protein [Deltaproteobacteria bacterium]|nr:phosphate/phosphite/phosphonate ABC transporter substrate-binding protein [Deltaproteobacteria bacterium]
MGRRLENPWRIPLVGIVLLLLPQPISAGSISLGSIGVSAARETKKFLPLANYLARYLQAEGVQQGKVVVAKTIPEMAALMRNRKVDLYIDSPFPVVAVSRLSGSRLFLRRWKKGASDYRSAIFARQDSGFVGLEDLKGKMIVFKEPHSSSGYFLPKMAIAAKKLKLSMKKEASDSVGPHEVGYVFSYDDENTLVWVLRRKVSAGATDDQSFKSYAKGNLGTLKVIHETFPIPRQIAAYRADLDPKLVARIREILINMDQMPMGRKALQAFERTTKFDELPDQAIAPVLKERRFVDAEFGIK